MLSSHIRPYPKTITCGSKVFAPDTIPWRPESRRISPLCFRRRRPRRRSWIRSGPPSGSPSRFQLCFSALPRFRTRSGAAARACRATRGSRQAVRRRPRGPQAPRHSVRASRHGRRSSADRRVRADCRPAQRGTPDRTGSDRQRRRHRDRRINGADGGGDQAGVAVTSRLPHSARAVRGALPLEVCGEITRDPRDADGAAARLPRARRGYA